MKQIEADFERRISLPGVPEPVQRPVDIDRSVTGFAHLRSLRIYRFPSLSAIDGHAEEDEVFLVVLRGAIQLKLGIHEEAAGAAIPMFLQAPGTGPSSADACTAYLPPGGAYYLEAIQEADVAYARATPPSGPVPFLFEPQPVRSGEAVALLLDQSNYAQQLRIRLYRVETGEDVVSFCPLQQDELEFEALLHTELVSAQSPFAGESALAVTTPSQQADVSTKLSFFDTLAITPGELPSLAIPANTSGLLLLVLARSGV